MYSTCGVAPYVGCICGAESLDVGVVNPRAIDKVSWIGTSGYGCHQPICMVGIMRGRYSSDPTVRVAYSRGKRVRHFVPMLWGLVAADDPSWTAAATAAKSVSGYNESDLNLQANIFRRPDYFLADYTGCRINFMPIHYYGNETAALFQVYVTKAQADREGSQFWSPSSCCKTLRRARSLF